MVVLQSEFEKSATKVAEAPTPDLPEICFVGRSNVGKSSVLNTLTARKQLARVSKTPGRTRLLNFFRIDLADHPRPPRRTASIRLCDLPGYGFAKAPKDEKRLWGAMIEAYLHERPSLVAVVMLVDAEVGPQPKDFEMLEFLSNANRSIIVVATKADRLARTRRGAALDKIAKELEVPRGSVLAYSSHEPIGREELWRTICAAAGIFGRESEKILGASFDEVGDEP
jgi:GTP-binding protein